MKNHLFAMIQALGLTSADAIAQTGSQCFDVSVWQLLTGLVSGGRTVIIPDEVAHQPSALLRTLEAEGITVVELVPSVLQAVCVAAERQGERRPALSRLRWLLATGEALPPSLCARWFALYPGVPIVNAFGPTECADDVALHAMTGPPEGSVTPIGAAHRQHAALRSRRSLGALPGWCSGRVVRCRRGRGRG